MTTSNVTISSMIVPNGVEKQQVNEDDRLKRQISRHHVNSWEDTVDNTENVGKEQTN